MHGVTHEITLTAEVQGTDTDPWGNERVGLEITGQLNRGDYGMKFNQALGSGNMLVSDKVKLASTSPPSSRLPDAEPGGRCEPRGSHCPRFVLRNTP